MIEYRRDIDGLRAIAVLSVVLYHFGLKSLSGGFVGVDVFFVISGFLITSIIDKDIGAGKFTFSGFYERRIKRIFPALFVVCFVVLIYSWLFADPVLLKKNSEALVSVFSYLSNFYFFLTTGYFSDAAHKNFLLHTWSLSLEEQFYIFFPVLLLLFRKQRSILLLAVIFLGFVLSVYLSKESPDAGYYLLFSRMWELALGGGAALCLRNSAIDSGKFGAELLSILGLSLVLASLFFIDVSDPFPGFVAIFPVLGTCLLMVYGGRGYLVSCILGFQPLVYIGLLSYSIYLWHQPVVALFSRYDWGHYFWAMVFVTGVVSWISYKVVEVPCRKIRSKKVIWGGWLFGSFFFLVVSVVGIFSTGDARYLEFENSLSSQALVSPYRKACHTEGVDYLSPSNACVLGNGEKKAIVIGDSHGVELGYSIGKLEGVNLTQLTFSACFPSEAVYNINPGCREWLDESVEYVLSVNPDYLFISFWFEKYYSDSYELSLFEEFITRLKPLSGKVFIVGDSPSITQNVYSLYYPVHIFGSQSRFDYEIHQRQPVRGLRERLEKYSMNSGFSFYSLRDYLCQNECGILLGGKLMYFDDNHLSVEATDFFIEKIHGDIE